MSNKVDFLMHRIGLVVLNSQTVETGLKFILTFISQDKTELNYDTPYMWLKNKRTLGQLLGLLKERLNMGEEFEEILQKYLEHRNCIVHNFFESFDLEDSYSLSQAIKFVDDALEYTHEVGSVLRAFSVSNEKELGINLSEKIRNNRALYIEERYLKDIDTYLKKQ